MGLAFQISRGLRANLRANLHTGPSLGPHRQPPHGLPLHKGEVNCHPLSGEEGQIGIERGANSGVSLALPCQGEGRGGVRCSPPTKGKHEVGSVAFFPAKGRSGVRGVFSSDAGAPSGSGRAWCHPPAPAPRPPARRGRCGSPPPRRCGPCRRCTRRWHPPRWWGWWRGSAP